LFACGVLPTITGAEECDDGNTLPGDGCDEVCLEEPTWTCTGVPSVCTTTCGDGVIDRDEVCDDGGMATGDGCSAICQVEAGWVCAGEPSTCALATPIPAMQAPLRTLLAFLLATAALAAAARSRREGRRTR